MKRNSAAETRRQVDHIDEQLVVQVQERLARGLAPPAEAYQIQNRTKIDWSLAPSWARPIDPEIFDGCGHEG